MVSRIHVAILGVAVLAMGCGTSAPPSAPAPSPSEAGTGFVRVANMTDRTVKVQLGAQGDPITLPAGQSTPPISQPVGPSEVSFGLQGSGEASNTVDVGNSGVAILALVPDGEGLESIAAAAMPNDPDSRPRIWVQPVGYWRVDELSLQTDEGVKDLRPGEVADVPPTGGFVAVKSQQNSSRIAVPGANKGVHGLLIYWDRTGFRSLVLPPQ